MVSTQCPNKGEPVCCASEGVNKAGCATIDGVNAIIMLDVKDELQYYLVLLLLDISADAAFRNLKFVSTCSQSDTRCGTSSSNTFPESFHWETCRDSCSSEEDIESSRTKNAWRESNKTKLEILLPNDANSDKERCAKESAERIKKLEQWEADNNSTLMADQLFHAVEIRFKHLLKRENGRPLDPNQQTK